MMAGLPEEARDKVIDNDRSTYWLCTAYREYYGIFGFQINPQPKGAKLNYGHSLSQLELSEVITILEELIEERKNG